MPSPLVFYGLLMRLKPFLPNLTRTTDFFHMDPTFTKDRK